MSNNSSVVLTSLESSVGMRGGHETGPKNLHAFFVSYVPVLSQLVLYFMVEL